LSSIPEILLVSPARPSCTDGDRARLERLFDEDHDFIWRLLRRLGLSHERADDAAQHVFVVAAERLDEIRPESERAFLFGTALRTAQSFLRKERRWVLEADMDFHSSRNESPEDVVDRRRAVDLMDQTLGTMDIELRTAFVLFEIEDLTAPEIATLTGWPVGTVASRLRRAREALRGAFPTLEEDDRESRRS
jgi:RNA polymerase sigma-70 factor (ECF subfamily)